MNVRLFIPDDTAEPDEPEGDPLLFEAAKDGDVERVRALRTFGLMRGMWKRSMECGN